MIRWIHAIEIILGPLGLVLYLQLEIGLFIVRGRL